MSTMRRCSIVAAVFAAAFITEALFFGGCARVMSQVHVGGVVLDTAGVPLEGAEVYALPVGLPPNDEALARVRSDDESDTPPEYREVLFARTDAGGRYTLVLRLGRCRSMGPIATTIRALIGERRPSPQGYAVVAQTEGHHRAALETSSGGWAASGRQPRASWTYEMPQLKLEAK